jgi:phosphoribosylanthranilate isomerase
VATHVKICGVTSVDDALAAVDLGASAIGLNFVPSSVRKVDVARAKTIADAVHAHANAKSARVQVVGVVADLSVDEMRALVRDAGLDCLQLHGDESPDVLSPLLPHAYKAVRIENEDDVTRAAAFPGEHILADAKIAGALGGTGKTFDWSLVADLAKTRKLTLAGGLTPENVALAVVLVAPYCVDVASGVERTPGVKDRAKMRAFIEAARRV